VRKVVLRLGQADPRTVRRVLTYSVNDGVEFEIVSPPDAKEVEIPARDGDTIDYVEFVDVAEDGSCSKVMSPFGRYVVSDKPPMLSATCLFSRTYQVDDPSDAVQEASDELIGQLDNVGVDDVDLPSVDDGIALPNDDAVLPGSASDEALPMPSVKPDDATVPTFSELYPAAESSPETAAEVATMESTEESTQEVSVAEIAEEVAEEVAPSEAEAIRRYLGKNPDATNQQVIDALSAVGVEVATSQVSRARKQLAG
jgi:hypothetical protein